MPAPYLIDFNALGTGETPPAVTLHFGSAAFCSQASDTPANTVWHPYVQDAGNVEQHLFEPGKTSGGGGTTFGTITLVNIDGALDYLADYRFDGRDVWVYQLPEGATTLAERVAVYHAVVDRAEFSRSSIKFRLRDPLALLDTPVCTSRYAGSNALPAGLEGVESDLKGKPKPMLFGHVRNISPPCVNTSRLIYQVHDGAVDYLPAVYDNGTTLTPGAAYASQNDMETNAPAAGAFRVWNGYFRLGTAPTGQITCDAGRVNGGGLDNASVFRLLQLLIPAIDGSLVSVTQESAGIWVNDETTILQAARALADSLGYSVGYDPAGDVRVVPFGAPTNSPALTITTDHILQLEREMTALPHWQISINYAKNYTVQTQVAGSVNADRRAQLAQAWQTETIENQTVQQDYHLLSTPLKKDTALNGAADAEDEAQRLNTLLGISILQTPRQQYRVTCKFSTDEISELFPGVTVTLVFPRFGLSAGKNFVVLGMIRELAANQTTLVLWG